MPTIKRALIKELNLTTNQSAENIMINFPNLTPNDLLDCTAANAIILWEKCLVRVGGIEIKDPYLHISSDVTSVDEWHAQASIGSYHYIFYLRAKKWIRSTHPVGTTSKVAQSPGRELRVQKAVNQMQLDRAKLKAAYLKVLPSPSPSTPLTFTPEELEQYTIYHGLTIQEILSKYPSLSRLEYWPKISQVIPTFEKYMRAYPSYSVVKGPYFFNRKFISIIKDPSNRVHILGESGKIFVDAHLDNNLIAELRKVATIQENDYGKSKGQPNRSVQ